MSARPLQRVIAAVIGSFIGTAYAADGRAQPVLLDAKARALVGIAQDELRLAADIPYGSEWKLTSTNYNVFSAFGPGLSGSGHSKTTIEATIRVPVFDRAAFALNCEYAALIGIGLITQSGLSPDSSQAGQQVRETIAVMFGGQSIRARFSGIVDKSLAAVSFTDASGCTSHATGCSGIRAIPFTEDTKFLYVAVTSAWWPGVPAGSLNFDFSARRGPMNDRLIHTVTTSSMDGITHRCVSGSDERTCVDMDPAIYGGLNTLPLREGTIRLSGDPSGSHYHDLTLKLVKAAGPRPDLSCPVFCDDGKPCTVDRLTNGVCSHTPDDSIALPQNSANPCVRQACSNGNIRSQPLTGWFNFSPRDCLRDECQNGFRVSVPDDAEILPQFSTHDCEQRVCRSGMQQIIADLTETPTQELYNCRREVCGPYGVEYRVDDSDRPLQDAPDDCIREVCDRGGISSIPDDSETPPPDENGARRVCRGSHAVLE